MLLGVIVADSAQITGSDSPVVAAVPVIPLLLAGYGVLRHRRGVQGRLSAG